MGCVGYCGYSEVVLTVAAGSWIAIAAELEQLATILRMVTIFPLLELDSHRLTIDSITSFP